MIVSRIVYRLRSRRDEYNLTSIINGSLTFLRSIGTQLSTLKLALSKFQPSPSSDRSSSMAVCALFQYLLIR